MAKTSLQRHTEDHRGKKLRPLRTSVPSVVKSSLLLPTSLEFVRLQARRRGDKGGMVFRNQHICYGALAAAVDELAAWLAKRGGGGGHHIAIMAANGPAMVAATYAAWAVGAVSVPIAVRSTAAETALLLTHARANAIICDADRADLAREAAALAGITAVAIDADLPLHPRII